jgi:beta-glucuronidase
MKTFRKTLLLPLSLALAFSTPARGDNIPDLFLHDGQSLSGEWKSIMDPYETGFYDYRYSERDLEPEPSRSETFYLDVKPADPGERVEYDFDLSPPLQVPGDWPDLQ